MTITCHTLELVQKKSTSKHNITLTRVHQLKYLGYLKLIGSGYNWCHWSLIRWDPCGALNLDVQDVYANGCTVNGTVQRILSTEKYQCRHRQGYHPQRCISAATGKDTIHRDVSVLLQARIPSTEGYQCRSRQGYYPQRSISAATGKDTIHRDVSVPPQARIPSTEMYQCCSRQGYLPQRGISVAPGKDTIHREVSVPPQARIPSTEMYQCHH